MSETSTAVIAPIENKLILLYLLKKINIPITDTRLIMTVLENRLMNYFEFAQAFGELKSEQYIVGESATTSNANICYRITYEGKALIETLGKSIPLIPKKLINRKAEEFRKDVKKEMQLCANYFIDGDDDKYVVECKILEDTFSLFEAKISVASKEDAVLACENWKENAASIYQNLIATILTTKT